MSETAVEQKKELLKALQVPGFKVNIVCDHELELLESLISLLIFSRKIRGDSSKILRKALISLLAIYIKNGYNFEARKMAAKTLGVSMEMINCMNNELRKQGVLIQDKIKSRINVFSPDVDALRNFYKLNAPKGVHFIFNLKV